MFNGNALSSKSPLPAFINPPLLKLRSPIPVALSGPESGLVVLNHLFLGFNRFRSSYYVLIFLYGRISRFNRRNESFYMLIFVCVIDRSSQNGLVSS